MAKFALLIFGSLTLGAAYLTAYDVGVQEASAYHSQSVRQGSAGHSRYGGGK
ncbi:hypothetical protein [Candidatus Venteria ishoeyi]|uniref:Uncharacterized protein n=1 Tax=Candidatus Venteria ishoeyi TaxID=1899563 RepID=A0A1H6F4H5_9GAMM|nr:hypothetical protein [Candidatus Venteria ishoeyi]MDM8548037.1 hypothetical protein [Candidatus Venteria ishoeyi]SEH04932.1 Uncharacterised protein [Candidatus Venteria ishoeyi]SEH05030.1 Uncharacterised protein [Candidatus Venteria ishoeyi]